MYIALILDIICWSLLIFMTHMAGFEKSTVALSIVAVIVLAIETTTIAQIKKTKTT